MKKKTKFLFNRNNDFLWKKKLKNTRAYKDQVRKKGDLLKERDVNYTKKGA